MYCTEPPPIDDCISTMIEAVTVCVNYADFLVHTLPVNRCQFDKLVVVTDTKDEQTKKICDYFNVQCVQTDVMYEGGDTFNKGKAINAGLKELSMKGWVAHIDADIYLPPKTRNILDRLPLDSQKIYGADRLMCSTFEDWVDYLCDPGPIQDAWIFIHATRFPLGVRLAEYWTNAGGYEPIGFFQLWNPNSSGVRTYPDKHGFADRTDVLFCKQWPRTKRELLPEIILIHLESAKQMAANWQGRKTPRFAPPPQKQSTFFGKIKSALSL